jgi:hypothetical protein
MAETDRLPTATQAVIDDRKITGYLLSDSHPTGRSKARFFKQHGFRTRSWRRLRDALLAHARQSPIEMRIETQFGTKYILVGPLAAPDGRTPTIPAVWFVERGEVVPRLVTVYPAPGVGR